MTLKPAEWLRACPDCGGPLYMPADRHTSCQERRHLARTAWTACNRCGGLNGRHAATCTAQEENR